jgi:hypothetical protein
MYEACNVWYWVCNESTKHHVHTSASWGKVESISDDLSWKLVRTDLSVTADALQ